MSALAMSTLAHRFRAGYGVPSACAELPHLWPQERRISGRGWQLADFAAEGLVLCRHGCIKDANAAFLDLIDLDWPQAHDRQLTSFIAPEYHGILIELSSVPHEIEILTGALSASLRGTPTQKQSLERSWDYAAICISKLLPRG